MAEMAGAEGFHVDMARAPDAIKELEWALQQLFEMRDETLALGTVNPGSNDSVSIDAARALGAVAVGGPGSLLDALNGGIDHLQSLIESLNAEIREYQQTDSTIRRHLETDHA